MSPSPTDPGGWGQISGPGREFDYRFNRNNVGVDELTSWTFNVTPGAYRVSTTWAFGFSGFAEAAAFTIFDETAAGRVVRGGRNINQKASPAGADYPPGFMFPAGTAGATTWERIDTVNITGDALTVQLQADHAVEFVLADSILIDRLGDVPVGPEIVVVENNRNAAAGWLDYGMTQLNHPLDKMFTIANSGTSDLAITSAVTLNGEHAGAFQVVSGPAPGTVIAPGGTDTFVVRLIAAYDGVKNAMLAFTTNDADEGAVNLPITGDVLAYRIIDDQDTADGYSHTEMIEAPSGISHQGDVSFANSWLVQPAASSVWTFGNMSPGVYYVALTWFDTSSSPAPYSSNTPVTVWDGIDVEGVFSVNQKLAPSSFTLDGVAWLIIGFFEFSAPTVTVTMTNIHTDGVILADGVLINRVGGGIPAGNGASLLRRAVAGPPSDDGGTDVSPAWGRPTRLEGARDTVFSVDLELNSVCFAIELEVARRWNNDLQNAARGTVKHSCPAAIDTMTGLCAAGCADAFDLLEWNLPDWLDETPSACQSLGS
jgi:hypothetical protein